MEPDSSPDVELAEVRRAHRLMYYIIAGWALCFAVIALWPALKDGELWSSRYDWRYFETMSEMARRTVLWYRQLPLWNPRWQPLCNSHARCPLQATVPPRNGRWWRLTPRAR